MGKENLHIIYTADDIQQYFAGKLSKAEMHALEKAALDDPFLAEAMEGYGDITATNLNPQLASLRNSFAEEKTSKLVALTPRKKRFTLWKEAAAILLLCGGIAITLVLTNKRDIPGNTIAKVENKKVEDTSANMVVETSPAELDKPAAGSTEAAEVLSKRQEGGKALRNDPVVDSAFVYRPAAPATKDLRDIAGGGYISEAQKSSPENAGANANASTLNNQEPEEISNKSSPGESRNLEANSKENFASLYEFSARVIGPNNRPLPFAKVIINNQANGRYTDAKGNIRFTSTDSLVTVAVKSAGYIAREYTLTKSSKGAIISLQEDMTAVKNNPAISGKALPGAARQRTVLQAHAVMEAEPADGWENYDAYVKNNLSLSDSIVSEKIHGEVQVSFDVSAGGVISNINFDKRLCADCDKEVLRLLKEGPGWKVTKGLKANARLKVKF